MKAKFKGLDFGSVKVLSNDDKKKVKGGYWGDSGNNNWGGDTSQKNYGCLCVTGFNAFGQLDPNPPSTNFPTSSFQEACGLCQNWCFQQGIQSSKTSLDGHTLNCY